MIWQRVLDFYLERPGLALLILGNVIFLAGTISLAFAALGLRIRNDRKAARWRGLERLWETKTLEVVTETAPPQAAWALVAPKGKATGKIGSARRGAKPSPGRRPLVHGGVELRCTLRFEEEAHRDGYKVVAGVDEVGCGALCGPVVAGAAILGEGFDTEGLDDSKRRFWRRLHLRSVA